MNSNLKSNQGDITLMSNDRISTQNSNVTQSYGLTILLIKYYVKHKQWLHGYNGIALNIDKQ